MILLLLAIVAMYIAIWRGLTPRRWGGVYGAGSWFLVLYSSFVMVGYLTHYVSAGLPQEGPAGRGLLVATTGLIAATVGVTLLNTKHSRGRETSVVVVRTTDRDLLIMSAVLLVPAWLYFVMLGNVPLFQGIGSLTRVAATV